MENIRTMLKATYLVRLAILLAVIFAGDMFPMIQTTSQRERGKIAAAKLMAKKHTHLKDEEYTKTRHEEKMLQKAQQAFDAVDDEEDEQRMQREREQISTSSLEQLVVLFNQKNALNNGKKIEMFEKIDEIVKKILKAIIYQYQLDHKLAVTYPSGASYSPTVNAQDSLFKNYTGKLIPIRLGSRVIYIPDYKVLANLDKNTEQLMMKKINWQPYSGILSELKKIIPENFLEANINNLDDTDRREDVVGFYLKALQNSYNALSWRQRWLQIPW